MLSFLVQVKKRVVTTLHSKEPRASRNKYIKGAKCRQIKDAVSTTETHITLQTFPATLKKSVYYLNRGPNTKVSKEDVIPCTNGISEKFRRIGNVYNIKNAFKLSISIEYTLQNKATKIDSFPKTV